MLKVGEKAPDFSLTDQSGHRVNLADYRGKKTLVVYFYPRDETPGCRAEACAFRDQYEDFQEAGACVLGISSDSEGSHKKFAARHRLPFTLLSDPGGKARKAYKVPKTFGLIPGRVTYVIDKEGVIRLAFDSQLNIKKHVAEARRVLLEL